MNFQINQLNQIANVSSSVQIPVFDTDNGFPVKMSVSQLSAYILSLIGGSDALVTQYASPNATGFSVTLGSVPNTWLLLTPTAGFAAGTLVYPATPTDQDEINVNTTQAVTTLTNNGNGKTVNGAPTTLAANAFFKMRYDGVNASWYRVS